MLSYIHPVVPIWLDHIVLKDVARDNAIFRIGIGHTSHF